MPLPSSGQISINDIRNEIGTSNGSLGYLSDQAEFLPPDAMSDFYSYNAYSFYAGGWALAGPCSYDYYDIYLRANGEYYGSNDGGSSYTLMYSLNENWYEYLYYDFFFDANVYRWYSINSTSTVLTDEGNFLSSC
jgi:hypothetical protein